MKQTRFNMQGYLIEFDAKTNRWTWNKWEYADSPGGRRVVRRRGSLEFMKMMRALFDKEPYAEPPLQSKEEMEKTLKKDGVDFVFLYQGEISAEDAFKTVEEAEKHHRLETYPMWDLTNYWFGYDDRKQTWAMYDAVTGQLEFTPQHAVQRLNNRRSRLPGQTAQPQPRNRFSPVRQRRAQQAAEPVFH